MNVKARKPVLIEIDQDLGITFQDAGPWRRYHLSSTGRTIEELFENGVVEEIARHGHVLKTYGIDCAENEVAEAATEALYRVVKGTYDRV